MRKEANLSIKRIIWLGAYADLYICISITMGYFIVCILFFRSIDLRYRSFWRFDYSFLVIWITLSVNFGVRLPHFGHLNKSIGPFGVRWLHFGHLIHSIGRLDSSINPFWSFESNYMSHQKIHHQNPPILKMIGKTQHSPKFLSECPSFSYAIL